MGTVLDIRRGGQQVWGVRRKTQEMELVRFVVDLATISLWNDDCCHILPTGGAIVMA